MEDVTLSFGRDGRSRGSVPTSDLHLSFSFGDEVTSASVTYGGITLAYDKKYLLSFKNSFRTDSLGSDRLKDCEETCSPSTREKISRYLQTLSLRELQSIVDFSKSMDVADAVTGIVAGALCHFSLILMMKEDLSDLPISLDLSFIDRRDWLSRQTVEYVSFPFSALNRVTGPLLMQMVDAAVTFGILCSPLLEEGSEISHKRSLRAVLDAVKDVSHLLLDDMVKERMLSEQYASAVLSSTSESSLKRWSNPIIKWL